LLKILDNTDSTNNYAMGLIRQGAARNGTAVAALNQTAGKGQRGKNWQTEPGANIALSIMVKTDMLKAEQQFLLSMAAALAAHDFIKKYIPFDTTIKWPNDLYWRDRKAGGILIENVFGGSKWKWAVVGIGINVNQTRFNTNLPNPVSMRQITEREFDIVKLCHELYEKILEYTTELSVKDTATLLKEYNKRLYCLDKRVKLKKGALTFETTIKKVTEHGQLITQDVFERSFDFGEVEWVL
jgi:BirA family transcriptional regulator, biotin operon repressor / biotin---[acetyl-CoA-carboxylase] ligase